MGLEHIQSIFERLYFKERLHKDCKDCPLIIEVSKLLDMAKEKQYEEIEKEIGNYLI